MELPGTMEHRRRSDRQDGRLELEHCRDVNEAKVFLANDGGLLWAACMGETLASATPPSVAAAAHPAHTAVESIHDIQNDIRVRSAR